MLRIDKLIPGGMALTTLPDGKKAFFWNALPEEIVVEYDVVKNKSHYFEAIATKIENPSPHRQEPKDACFLATSPWQILNYDYELSQKQELIVEIFREQGISIDKPEIATDFKDYFYRNKMEYALYWDREQSKILPAFHARGSHRKIPVTSSSIERPELFHRATEIIDELNTKHEEARKYQSLLLRCNTKGEISGGLYENKKPHPVFDNLTDKILGQEFSYSPNGFFQINLPVYEMALKEIKKHINTDSVLDLYAGVGTIGLTVAPDCRLALVEVDKSAYKELERNCTMRQVITTSEEHVCRRGKRGATEARDDGPEGAFRRSSNNLPTPILSKSEEVLSFINSDQTIILDPPRAGLDQKLVAHLAEVRPKTIIYLSCNPITQARDIKQLLDAYEIKKIKTFNFFPHTPHIENLVVLERN